MCVPYSNVALASEVNDTAKDVNARKMAIQAEIEGKEVETAQDLRQ